MTDSPVSTAPVACKACSGTGRSRYRDNACCDQCDGWGKVIAPVSASGIPLEQGRDGGRS